MLRVATVVGCNYPGTASELHGCVNDALLMRQILVRTYGFKEHNITLLIDDHRHMTTELPTGGNIKRALHAMVRRAVDETQRGRRPHLCFYFSGHGTLLERPHEGHEAIVPSDHNGTTSSRTWISGGLRALHENVHEDTPREYVGWHDSAPSDCTSLGSSSLVKKMCFNGGCPAPRGCRSL